MPTLITRSQQDPKRLYKWGALGLLLAIGVGGGTIALFNNQSSHPTVQPLSASEQSLNSLDIQGDPASIQAAGSLISENASGPYAKRNLNIDSPESMLYQAPAGSEAAGSPMTKQEINAHKIGEDSKRLVHELNDVAKGSKTKDRGWGGETARSGFSVPRANFGAFSGFGSSGGSGANFTLRSGAGTNGSGGNSGYASRGGSSMNTDLSGLPQSGNQSLNSLRQAQALLAKAASASRPDDISGYAAKRYDGAANRPDMMPPPGRGPGVGGLREDSVPGNLKADDPNQKNIKPPSVPSVSAKTTKEDSQLQMQEEAEKLLISAAISGVAGTVFSSVGTSIATTAGLELASKDVTKKEK
jgi:hypothetical protein